MGKILGLDYGEKRIGLAISDEEQKYAFAFETIENTDDQEVFDYIKEVIKKENIEKIIIGLPFNLKGEDTVQTKVVRKFSELVESKLGVKIDFIDERFTSRMADDIFRRAEIKARNRKKRRDSVAAALILQTYLDKSKVKM